jgi:adenine phosphoribosyltransferase
VKVDDLKKWIRDVPDFPVKGIIFKDITPLLKEPSALRFACDTLADRFAGKGVSAVCGMEARGFIFGAVLAYRLGVGFIPLRKPGKLPSDTRTISYQLEYGTATLEVHKDAVALPHLHRHLDGDLDRREASRVVARLRADDEAHRALFAGVHVGREREGDADLHGALVEARGLLLEGQLLFETLWIDGRAEAERERRRHARDARRDE